MEKLKKLYETAKSAKVGEECTCPSCGSKFIKDNYQQAFCKSKAKTKCKDKYWNTVTPEKRNNTTRISPRNKQYQGHLAIQREIERSRKKVTFAPWHDDDWSEFDGGSGGI